MYNRKKERERVCVWGGEEKKCVRKVYNNLSIETNNNND